jgi:dTDP-4-dehydrorhamnose 3,5-epimerase-like enzyme
MTSSIDGLEWQPSLHARRDDGVPVVSFPTTHLVHLVFHGHEPFRHTHYGIHLGFSDRLTFLGSSDRVARGYFVDCRRASRTRHQQATFEFSPSIDQTLIVPNGVAHAFEGLEEVDTINAFDALLPDPSLLLTSQSPWATGADIQYFALDAKPEDFPVVSQSQRQASERFYELLSEMQAATLGAVAHEYPHLEDVSLPDGTSARLIIRKSTADRPAQPEFESLSSISGLGWKRHLVVWSGPEAGYSALVERSSIEVMDYFTTTNSRHEERLEAVHAQHLTFVGAARKQCRLRIQDRRTDSPTHGKSELLEFFPSPLRFLVIPPGVAYVAEHIDDAFIVSRPNALVENGSTPTGEMSRDYLPGLATSPGMGKS